MTLITSECGATRFLSIKWPYSPRVVPSSICLLGRRNNGLRGRDGRRNVHDDDGPGQYAKTLAILLLLVWCSKRDGLCLCPHVPASCLPFDKMR